MKKYLLLSLLAFGAIMATSCTDTNGYRVDVQVEGLEKGQTVYLSLMQGKLPVAIDSAKVSGQGSVQFKGVLEVPMLARISEGKKTVKEFYLENSPITISGNLEDRDNIQVTGSAEQDLYEAYQKKLAEQPNNEAGKQQKSIIQQEFVKNNPGSVAAAYTLFRQMSPRMDFEKLREYAAGFNPELREKSIYLQMTEKLADTREATSPGCQFVDFALPNTEGEVIPLSSVVGQTPETYVLLDFWASWCPPCRAENPNVVAAYNEYHKKGFTVFGVSLDRPGEGDKWKKAIADDKLDWTNVSDLKFWECEPAAMYGVGSIPSNVLIGPDGVIVARNLQGEELLSKLGSIYLGIK